jgi:hypothetical protein
MNTSVGLHGEYCKRLKKLFSRGGTSDCRPRLFSLPTTRETIPLMKLTCGAELVALGTGAEEAAGGVDTLRVTRAGARPQQTLVLRSRI